MAKRSEEGGEGSASDGEGGGDGPAPEGLHWTLVEYVRGVKAQRWKLELGKIYMVGRNGSEVAQIEVHHASLSRRHCSLAMTLVEDSPVLVALDHGSANGTFVNKQRLEKEVGLKISINELKYISFGDCPNGYRVLANDGGDSGARDASRQAAAKDAPDTATDAKSKLRAEEEWHRKAAAAKRMAAEARQARQGAAGAARQPAPAVPPRKKRGSWRTEDADAYVKRRTKDAEPSGGAAGAEIEWPEDWR